MADSHPFANAGLGMFGSAERQYAQKGMSGGNSGGDGGLLGNFLGSLIGLSSQKKSEQTQSTPIGAVAPVVPATQYEPQTAFPDILQQQYVTPYQPGYAPPQGFKTPTPFSTQSQASTSGYHPATEALWGGK